MNKKSLKIFLTANALALSLLLVVFIPGQAKSQLDRETMTHANQFYEAGHFNEASQIYQQLVDQGYSHSSLFYNLGNAHYRQGNLGKAILNYERAARLDPRDADIQANLSYAQQQTINQYDAESNSPLEQLTQIASSLLTLNEMSVLVLVLFWLLVALFIVYRHNHVDQLRKVLGYSMVMVLLILVLGALTVGNRVYAEKTHPVAVVTAESVDVHSDPDESGLTQFTLHSGVQVILLDTRGRWAQLALLGEQFQGWIPVEAVEAI